jgi:hypothetical protein
MEMVDVDSLTRQRAIELPAFIGGTWVCPKKLGVHTILDIPM